MITYGGIELLQSTPELEELVRERIPASSLWHDNVHYNAGQTGRSVPAEWNVPYREGGMINRLHWPRDASRWSYVHVLCDGEYLEEIRALVYAGDQYSALDFIIGSDRKANEGTFITTPLYMLPPRPLFQASFAGPERHLYLLTLVDDRYFWWARPVNIAVTEGVTTWAQLYASVAADMGITLTVDAIEAEYKTPGNPFNGSGGCGPMVLDRIARSVGQRIVANLDGTYRAMGYDSSATILAANLAEDFPPLAGGSFDFDPDSDDNDLEGLLPATVRVLFPAYEDGAYLGSEVAVDVALVDLTNEEFVGARGDKVTTGYAGTHLARAGMVADWNGSVYTNQTELDAYALQYAQDWYRHALGTQDASYLGVVPWTPEGLSGGLWWSVDQTRVYRRSLCGEDLYPAAGTQGSSPPVSTNTVVNRVTSNQVYVKDLVVLGSITTPDPGCLSITKEVSGTTALSSTTWVDLTGSSETFSCDIEQYVSVHAGWEFDANGTAQVTYDGDGSGSADLYEGRVLLDGAQVGLISRFQAAHNLERKTILMPPAKVLLTAASHTIKMQARRASGSGSAQVNTQSGWQIHSLCLGTSGAGAPTITAPNITATDKLKTENFFSVVPSPLSTPSTDQAPYNVDYYYNLVAPTTKPTPVKITGVVPTGGGGPGDQFLIINTAEDAALELVDEGDAVGDNEALFSVTTQNPIVGPGQAIPIVNDPAASQPRMLFPVTIEGQPHFPINITGNVPQLGIPPNTVKVRLKPNNNAWSIYGLKWPWKGRQLELWNDSSYYVLLAHNSPSATNANERIQTPTGAALPLPPGATVGLGYDNNLERFVVRQGQSPPAGSANSSIVLGNMGTALDGDQASPGNNMQYGTDGSGTRGWYPKPTVAYTDILAAGGAIYRKFTVSHTDLQAASTTNTYTLFSLPARGVILDAYINHTAQFTYSIAAPPSSGNSFAAYTLDVGWSGSPAAILGAYGGEGPPTGSGSFSGGGSSSSTMVDGFSATDIKLTASVGMGDPNLDQSDAGSVDIWIKYAVLP